MISKINVIKRLAVNLDLFGDDVVPDGMILLEEVFPWLHFLPHHLLEFMVAFFVKLLSAIPVKLKLDELATKVLPQYEADDGALTKTQLSQLKKSAPKAKSGKLRSSLFEIRSN